MIEYPKIPSSKGFKHPTCVAFNKLDGSNVGVEWTPKRGFHKFRLRSRLFDHTDPDFGPAIEIFHSTLGRPLGELFKESSKFHRRRSITVFGEFWGPSTFAGNHYNLPVDEKRKITIFDCWLDGYGFLGPEDFISIFEDIIPIPQPVYCGKFTGALAEQVRAGKFKSKGVVEGVVIKAGKGGEDIEYAKIKTDEYMERLKKIFGNDWKKHWE
jgi:RNA ligase